MKIAMYVLCVLKFQDGTIVFTERELDKIKDAIEKGLKKQGLYTGDRKPRDGFEVYSLNHQKVGGRLSKGAKIESAEIGYYHHRVIVELTLDFAVDFSKLRKVRKQLKKWVDETIKCGVQDQINELVLSQQLKGKARVEFFYTYPLIVIGTVEKRSKLRQLVDKIIECSVKMKEQINKLVCAREIRKEAIVKFFTYPIIILKRRLKSSEVFPFSEETSSLCFDIVEPAFFYRSGKRHMMRVSIPGTILYPSRKRIGTHLLRDIVNAIYQYCLYEQKSITKKPFKNVLDENLLAKFWEQIFNRLGSRTIDIHTSRITFIAFWVAFSALIVSIGTLIVTWLL
jgi:hypothetical protein